MASHLVAEEQRIRNIKERTSQPVVNNKQKKPTEGKGNAYPAMNGKIKHD